MKDDYKRKHEQFLPETDNAIKSFWDKQRVTKSNKTIHTVKKHPKVNKSERDEARWYLLSQKPDAQKDEAQNSLDSLLSTFNNYCFGAFVKALYALYSDTTTNLTPKYRLPEIPRQEYPLYSTLSKEITGFTPLSTKGISLHYAYGMKLDVFNKNNWDVEDFVLAMLVNSIIGNADCHGNNIGYVGKHIGTLDYNLAGTLGISSYYQEDPRKNVFFPQRLEVFFTRLQEYLGIDRDIFVQKDTQDKVVRKLSDVIKKHKATLLEQVEVAIYQVSWYINPFNRFELMRDNVAQILNKASNQELEAILNEAQAEFKNKPVDYIKNYIIELLQNSDNEALRYPERAVKDTVDEFTQYPNDPSKKQEAIQGFCSLLSDLQLPYQTIVKVAFALEYIYQIHHSEYVERQLVESFAEHAGVELFEASLTSLAQTIRDILSLRMDEILRMNDEEVELDIKGNKLHHAIMNGGNIEELLAQDPDLLEGTDIYSRTPLMVAIAEDNMLAFEAIIDYLKRNPQAQSNLAVTDCTTFDAMMYTLVYNRLEMFKQVVRLSNTISDNFLLYCAKHEHGLKFLTFLLENQYIDISKLLNINAHSLMVGYWSIDVFEAAYRQFFDPALGIEVKLSIQHQEDLIPLLIEYFCQYTVSLPDKHTKYADLINEISKVQAETLSGEKMTQMASEALHAGDAGSTKTIITNYVLAKKPDVKVSQLHIFVDFLLNYPDQVQMFAANRQLGYKKFTEQTKTLFKHFTSVTGIDIQADARDIVDISKATKSNIPLMVVENIQKFIPQTEAVGQCFVALVEGNCITHGKRSRD